MSELPNHMDIMKTLVKAGYQAYVVGGAVRDSYAGLPVKDYDVTTSATPNEVLALFPGSKIINGNFSVSVYVPSSENDGVVEVTTMRAESDMDYSSGKPLVYHFTNDINADLARRDMTINAMAMDVDGNIIDPFGGREHIKARRIVAIGEPADRIVAHPIRMMRYARFATAMGDNMFTLDSTLVDAIIKHRRYLAKESWEAIGKEFMKGLSGKMTEKYILSLKHLGLLEVILPEVFATTGVPQNKYHNFNSVWMHILKCMKEADRLGLTPVEKLGVLLHDVGKPDTRQFRDPEYGSTFYGHEVVGMAIAEDITKRLRLTEEERIMVALAVRHHMYQVGTSAQARKFLRKMDVGGNTPSDTIADRARFVLRVRRADYKPDDNIRETRNAKEEAARALVASTLHEKVAFRVTDLKVNGNDIMQVLGIPEGRAVGNILEELLALVVDGTLENEREALLNESRRIDGQGNDGDTVLAGTA